MKTRSKIARSTFWAGAAAALASATAAALLAACGAPTLGTPPAATVVQAAFNIDAALARYRALLGPDNGGEPGGKPAGRREINWDGVPDAVAAPNFMPADFFNAAQAPRARGAHFTTPGTGVQASAKSGNPTGTAVRFGHINPSYAAIFKTSSPERLFSPVGSNIVDLTFFVPGTRTPAAVRGFGAVYTDVDRPHTSFEYFDRDNRSLGRYAVPVANEGLSFLGVVFERAVVARVRIEYGSTALGPNDGPDADVSVMDDFIYGEPQALGPKASSGY
ncbi:MAG: hypothetical protein HZC37_07175 [Burkholderiales bacterium]|nr:hypothetical protein [Burkholderiales bacterium]